MQSECAVLYNHLWPVQLYHISPHYLKNGKSFGKEITEHEIVFWFCLPLLLETFLILRIIERDINTNVRRFSCKHPSLLPNFNEIWIFSTDFQIYSNIKFHENSSSGSRVVPRGRTDNTGRQAGMTTLIVAFRNFVKALKNGSHYRKRV